MSNRDEDWLYVKNWWKFQHYKDRNPPWIKLHKSFQTDPAFQALSEIEQWRLVRLWVLASDMEGRLPRDPAYIAARLRLYHRLSCSNLLAKLDQCGLISQQDIRGDRGASASTKQRQRQKQNTYVLSLEKKVPKKVSVPRALDYPPDFLQFWEAYPRKVNKPGAFRAWKTSNINGELPGIMVWIQAAIQSGQWDDQKFIPHPSTFLNGRRWEDPLLQKPETQYQRTLKLVKQAEEEMRKKNEL